MVVNVNKNLSEDEKYNLIEYKKKCCKMRKNALLLIIRKYFNLGNLASL